MNTDLRALGAFRPHDPAPRAGGLGLGRPLVAEPTPIMLVRGGSQTSALNAYLDVLFQVGLIGLFAFVFMVGLAFARFWLLASRQRSFRLRLASLRARRAAVHRPGRQLDTGRVRLAHLRGVFGEGVALAEPAGGIYGDRSPSAGSRIAPGLRKSRLLTAHAFSK